MKKRTTKTIAGVEVNMRDLEALTMADLVAVYNETNRGREGERAVKSFRNKQEAIDRTRAALTRKVREESRSRRRPRSTPIPRTAKIQIVAAENPKKPGSDAAKRFRLYKDGATVEAVVAAGITNEDLRYDRDKGHIKLT